MALKPSLLDNHIHQGCLRQAIADYGWTHVIAELAYELKREAKKGEPGAIAFHDASFIVEQSALPLLARGI